MAGQVYVRDCTMVTPYPLLLFGKKTQARSLCAAILSLLKVIILPRQARDKHRESSAQKQTCDFCFLSAGGEIVVKHELMTICIDEWIEFRSPGKVAVLIKQLRAVSHERERERER